MVSALSLCMDKAKSTSISGAWGRGEGHRLWNIRFVISREGIL